VNLTRIFSYEKCGRFFQKCGCSYIGLSENERKDLLLNGEKVSEADFKTTHPTLLYAKVGKKNPYSDAYMAVVKYLIDKEDKKLRKAIKGCFNVALNTKSFKSFVGSMNKKKREELYILKDCQLNYVKVIEAFKIVLKDISPFLFTQECLALMFHDSNIMENILLRLYLNNIPALPVHDSVVCQRRHIKKVKRIMEEESKRYTGFVMSVEIK